MQYFTYINTSSCLLFVVLFSVFDHNIQNDPVDSTSEAQNANNSLESSLEVKPPIPAPRSKSRSPILHAYENSAVCHTAAVHTEVCLTII